MKRIMYLLLPLVFLGCAADDSATPDSMQPPGPTGITPTPDTPSGSPPAVTPSRNPTPVVTGPGEQVGLQEPMDSEERVVARPRRRMNVDQLRAAMEQVSGGIQWSERQGGEDVNLFEALSSTLGKPDYAFSTDEDLEPTVLFQKFLGDAARSICNQMLAVDLAALEAMGNDETPDWSPRILIHADVGDTHGTAPDAVGANIQSLVQKFHGRRLLTDAPGLAHWHWLFRTSVFVTDSPSQAWFGVCVGLFTHPDFYMY